MNKTQFYLSQCAEAASKSPMCFTLGAVMVKGGKVISSGFNHHRPHYDGAEVRKHGHRKPVSMHAEMHAIFNLTGMSPSFKKQVQGMERRVPQATRGTPPEHRTKGPQVPKGSAGLERCLSGPESDSADSSGSESPCSSASEANHSCGSKDSDKGWDARRRDPRVNGADIYVARFTKNGTGTAKPCWRCLEWCRWAGVKRIFHWNAVEGRFEVVKVNSAQNGQYETHADIRLFAGLGCETVYKLSSSLKSDMLVLNPVSALQSQWGYSSGSTSPSEDDFLDVMVEQAAHDYVAAHARAHVVRKRREQERRRQHLEDNVRHQAALRALYDRQRARSAVAYHQAPMQYSAGYSLEYLLQYNAQKEQERRRIAVAQQREEERAKALAELRAREEAERRVQARLRIRKAREEQQLLAFFGLGGSSIPVHSRRATQPARCRRVIQPLLPTQPRTSHDQSQNRLSGECDPDVAEALQRLLSLFAPPQAAFPSTSLDKGKEKAKEFPVTSASSSSPTSLENDLRRRMRTEVDPDVQAALRALYSHIEDTISAHNAEAVAGPSGASPVEWGNVDTSVPTESAINTDAQSASEPSEGLAGADGVSLHRTPALPPAIAAKVLAFYRARRARKLSLAQIKDVEKALHTLESTFQFPEHLDFNLVSSSASNDSDSEDGLAYTSNNTPVHVYEHALNELLTRLDAVESGGDLEVRRLRKEVVKEVECALHEVEQKVEESRERESEKSRERVQSAALTKAEGMMREQPQKNEGGGAAEVITPEAANETAQTVQSIEITEPSATSPPATVMPVATETPVASIAPPPAEAEESGHVSAEVSSAPVEAVDDECAQGIPFETSEFSATTIDPDAVDEGRIVQAPVLGDSLPTSDVEISPLSHSLPAISNDVVTEELIPTTTISLIEPVQSTSPTLPDHTVTAASDTACLPFSESSLQSEQEAKFTDEDLVPAAVLDASAPDSTPPPPPESGHRDSIASESSSDAEETFLLSSTPLSDEPRKPSETMHHAEEDIEIISSDEATKSESDWSDVEA
ncbi:hypothetical protein A0H81_05492 [Grifola frondosa]|uniref:CMP/dCMP-type deaminase domain-containing protein n=1 Tax=Grifola frondosa TaxID=5627 RepID=A0A1C7MDC6_GRIFR|nr:hypothetical protein A0H81_05492 [Grifola frondosa]